MAALHVRSNIPGDSGTTMLSMVMRQKSINMNV